MTDLVHPFERAGLGKAPFRFVGVSEKMYSPAPGVPAKPGGSCDYCGNGIRYEFHVRSADGQTFKVGCDCIVKVSDKGSRLLTDIERAMRQTKRAALAARIEAARATLSANPHLLTDRPHPHAPFAARGRTMRDYAEWMLAHAGKAGATKACHEIEAATQALAA